MGTILDDPEDAAALRAVRRIIRRHECSAGESASARALVAQIDARERQPRSIDPVIWALVAILTALAIAAIGGWFRIF